MTCDDHPLKPSEAVPPSSLEQSGERMVFAVETDDAGGRLDKWLSGRLETLTRTRIKALIDEGAVTKDGEVFTNPSWKLREGEIYALVIPAPVEADPKPEAIPLTIVFEDSDLIVIDKPAGMVVHPGAGNETGSLVNALLHHCGDSLSGIGGVARPGIVHRIDKDTSGLIVVAKSDVAHQGLARLFATHDIDRVYDAIAVGAPRPGLGTVNSPIARAQTDRRKMTVVAQRVLDNADTPGAPRGARHAVTHYKVLETYGRSRAKLAGDALASRIECRLETGRTHQIRVHLSSIGHPLIGDPTYGRGPGLAGLRPGEEPADTAIAVIRGFRRQALHARVLGFIHPITKDVLRFERDVPDDLNILIEALRAL